MTKSLFLAIVFAASFLVPDGARAAPVGGSKAESLEPERVALEIDHAALLKHQIAESAELSVLFVREDVTKALRHAHAMKVVEDSAAPALIVRLSWVNYAKSVYRVEIATRRPGQDAKTITQFERHFITDTALSEGVADSLADAVADLRKPQEEPTGKTAEADPLDEPDEPDEPDEYGEPDAEQTNKAGNTDDSGSKAPLGTLGKAGIGLLAGGVVVAGVGAGLLSQGRKIDEQEAQPVYRTGRDYRVPGIVVLASGGTLAVAGAVMLVLDRTGARKRHDAMVRVLPGLNGMTIVGRF